MGPWRKYKFKLKNEFYTIPKIIKLTKKLKIDLIHCNAYRLNPYAVKISKKTGIPVVTHIRWFKDVSHVKKYILHKAGFLIAVSKYIALFFKRYDNANIIYDGININDFKNHSSNKDIKKEFSIKDDVFLVGMMAQITPRKGHKDFIDAAALIKKCCPNIKFLCVGADILDKQLNLDDLKKYAIKKNADNIIFTGHRDDVENIYNALDCLVLPSHIEPFGRVILEAMASEIPVIATKSGGPQEIIKDGVNGLLVDIKSPEKIASCIMKIFNDFALREQIIKNGFDTVKNKFEIKKYVKKIELTYEQLLNKKHKDFN